MRTTKERYSNFIHFLTPSASYVSMYTLLQLYIIVLSAYPPARGVKVAVLLCDIECKTLYVNSDLERQAQVILRSFQVFQFLLRTTNWNSISEGASRISVGF